MKNTVQVNGYPQLFGYHHYLRYLILCSTEEETHTGLEAMEVE